MYTTPVMTKEVIRHAKIGNNQICHIGNPYIQADRGCLQLLSYYQEECDDAGVTAACFVPSASSMWFKRNRASPWEVRTIFVCPSSRAEYQGSTLLLSSCRG